MACRSGCVCSRSFFSLIVCVIKSIPTCRVKVMSYAVVMYQIQKLALQHYVISSTIVGSFTNTDGLQGFRHRLHCRPDSSQHQSCGVQVDDAVKMIRKRFTSYLKTARIACQVKLSLAHGCHGGLLHVYYLSWVAIRMLCLFAVLPRHSVSFGFCKSPLRTEKTRKHYAGRLYIKRACSRPELPSVMGHPTYH